MEFLQKLLDNSHLPFLSAFILGLMTAISPCPLATNITAIAYISKDLKNRKRVFLNGIVYTSGRALTYTAIGSILFFGASMFEIAGFFQRYGEKFLGPLLLIIGFFMLGIIKIKFPGFGKLTENIGQNSRSGIWGVLLLGIVFALAFCPYSGVLYFGMLIPITIASAKGLYLPVVYALATGLPVIIIAWLIAFTASGFGNFFKKLKTFEFWFKRFIAVIFVVVGLYYIYIFFIR